LPFIFLEQRVFLGLKLLDIINDAVLVVAGVLDHVLLKEFEKVVGDL
jgi:hypothetical protein